MEFKFFMKDDMGYPVYKDTDGVCYVDVAMCSCNPSLYTRSPDYGEPITSIDDLPRFKGQQHTYITEDEVTGTTSEMRLNYMFLNRMQGDCDYYLGYGDKSTRYLHNENEADHIAEMKRLYETFPDSKKPEWCTWEDILAYEQAMVL